MTLVYIFLSLFRYFEREREREGASGVGAERDGEREPSAGSVLSAQSLMWGSIS